MRTNAILYLGMIVQRGRKKTPTWAVYDEEEIVGYGKFQIGGWTPDNLVRYENEPREMREAVEDAIAE